MNKTGRYLGGGYITSLWVSRIGDKYLLRCGGRIMRCSVGGGGIGILKREGDGKTPYGQFRLLSTYMRYDRNARKSGKPIMKDQGWCDTPDDRNYNREVKLPYTASCERMHRQDNLYDIVIVLDYNMTCRRRCGGSAIFFHIASDDYAPTEGCVAIAKKDMEYLLPRLSSDCVMYIDC